MKYDFLKMIHLKKKFVTNTTFILPLFMSTLITYILTFNEWKKTFIPLKLTNLDLEFRVERWLEFMQCFENRPRPAVEPVNPVTQKKSGLSFMKIPIFKNPQKPSKTRNPIPVESPIEPINNFYFF